MLNLTVIAVGRLNAAYYKQAAAEYEKRLSAFCKVHVIELAEEAIAELDVQMEAAACDYEKLNELVKQKETAQAELDALYERWEQLSEEAEG